MKQSSHLQKQLSVRPGMSEAGRVVVLIQYRDMSCTSCTTWRRPSVLDDHDQLVTGLLLPVQGKTGADFT